MEFIDIADLFVPFGSLLFVLLISIVYYRKQKVATLENYIYSLLLFALVLSIILEIDALVIPYLSSNVSFTKFILKLKYICEMSWAFLLFIYIAVTTSKRNQGYVAYAENKEKKYFKKIIISFSSILIVFIILTIAFDMKFSIAQDILDDNYIIVTSIICVMMIFFWLIDSIYYLVLQRVVKKDPSKMEYSKSRTVKRLIIIILLYTIAGLGTILLVDNVQTNYLIATGVPLYLKEIAIALFIFGINLQVVALGERIPIKKFIPVIIFTPFYVIAQYLNFFELNIMPEISVYAVVTIFLYFSIENPDVKLIQELNLSRVEADNANIQKTRFLSVMSHEIRTPLNAIVGFGESLASSNISDEAKEEVEDIIMASNNLLDIVNGILDISKIETDTLEIIEKDYDSNKMFKEIVALAKARLASKPIDFRITIDSTIPPVLHGDYLRVKQVIVNILTNSIKYTREGYIDFNVNATAKDDKCMLQISVKDSGIGIKEEDLNKLFTKFQRLDLEKNSSTEGTGLGLAITKRLVELMNGDIDVASVYGQGTTFTITMEQGIVHKSVADVNKTEEGKAIVKLDPNVKVLVVDDNLMNIKVFARLLKDYNVVPESVTSGEETINLIKSGKYYDIIFLDDMMPNLTGTKTLELLKEIPNFKIPVIAFTANAISGMREQYLASGFSEYLAKPVKKEALNDILDIFLSSKKQVVTPAVKVIQVPNTPAKPVLAAPGILPAPNVSNIPKDARANHTKEFLESKGIDVNKCIGVLGDMETYNMLIDDFDNGILERINRIKTFKDEKDWENYSVETHDLKKDAKYLGFTELADIAYKHELAGKSSNEEEIMATFEELITKISEVIEIVNEYCKG